MRILAVRVRFGERESLGSLFAGNHVEGERDAPAGRGKLHRVGHQVHDDLLDLVHVGPHRIGILQAEGDQFDALGAGIEAEQVRDALERGDDVALRDLQLQFLVTDAIEIQELVHQREHPRRTALDDAHQLAVLTLYTF